MDQFGNQDTEIVELLGRLRETGPEYPPRLYAERRASIVAALAALPLAGAVGVSVFSKLATVIKSMSVVDKAILAVEVTAITGATAAGAVGAYIYRDALKSLILTTLGVPTQTVSPFPTLAAPVSTEPVVGTPEPTPTETPTPTVTGTIFVTDTNQPNVNQPESTQPPPNQPEPTNPGLHLGQTPKPESTKPPKGGG